MKIKIPLFFVLVFLLATSGLIIYSLSRYPQIIGIVNPKTKILLEAQELVDAVGNHIMLPEDEFPAISTVTDIDKIKDQKVFEQAKSGDKILVYINKRNIIVYRPGEDKIVAVGTLFYDQLPEETPTPAPTATPTLAPNEADGEVGPTPEASPSATPTTPTPEETPEEE